MSIAGRHIKYVQSAGFQRTKKIYIIHNDLQFDYAQTVLFSTIAGLF